MSLESENTEIDNNYQPKNIYSLHIIPKNLTLSNIKSLYPGCKVWRDIYLEILRSDNIELLQFCLKQTIDCTLISLDDADTIDNGYYQGKLIIAINWPTLLEFVTMNSYKFVFDIVDDNCKRILAHKFDNKVYLEELGPQYMNSSTSSLITPSIQESLDNGLVDIVIDMIYKYSPVILNTIIYKRYSKPIMELLYKYDIIIPGIDISIVRDDVSMYGKDHIFSITDIDNILYYDSYNLYIKYVSKTFIPNKLQIPYLGHRIRNQMVISGNLSLLEYLSYDDIYNLPLHTMVHKVPFIQFVAKYGYIDIIDKYYDMDIRQYILSLDNNHKNTIVYLYI